MLDIAQYLKTRNQDVAMQFFALDIPQGVTPLLKAEIVDYVNTEHYIF